MTQLVEETAAISDVDVPKPVEPTDRELLARFSRQRQEDAFSQLVDRHAALVLGVCTKILRDRHEAEDAFQATFLILAQQAHKTHWSSSVGGWLCKVAYRTAMTAAKKRHRRRDVVQPMDHVEATELEQWADIANREEQTALYEELGELPERFRAALVLCYLEGMQRAEAAAALECSDAAVKDRLARGKQMLRLRLARRGLVMSVAFATAATGATASQAASLTSLSALTTEACAASVLQGTNEAISATVQTMAQQGVHAMKLTTYSRLAVAALMLIGVGLMGVLYAAAEGEGEEGNAPQSAVVQVAGEEAASDELTQVIYVTDGEQEEGGAEQEESRVGVLLPVGRYELSTILPDPGDSYEVAVDFMGPEGREIVVTVADGQLRLLSAEMEEIALFELKEDGALPDRDTTGVFNLVIPDRGNGRTAALLFFRQGAANGFAALLPLPGDGEPFAAQITEMQNVVWETDDPSDAAGRLRAGAQIDLRAGFLEITFDDGAVVILQGPCQFTVTNRDAGALQAGRAVAGGENAGFVLESPSTSVIDFAGGSEFGVEVDEEGAAAVEVFQGEVEVQREDGEEGEPQRLEAGDSARLPSSG